MPNHVVNFVKASPHVLHALLNTRTPQVHVDFNQVVPINFPYRFYSIGIEHDVVLPIYHLVKDFSDFERAAYFKSIANNKSSLGVDENGNTLVLPAEVIYERTFQNIRVTGYPHSYSSNWVVWGTKWNAYDFMINIEEDDPFIVFQTAWSPPFPVFEQLSRMFPGEMVSVAYADEDIGSNFGLVGFVEGAYTKLTPHIFMNQKLKELLNVYEFCTNLHRHKHPLFIAPNMDMYVKQFQEAGAKFYALWKDTYVNGEPQQYFDYYKKLALTPFTGYNSDV